MKYRIVAAGLTWLSNVNFTIWGNLAFLELLWLMANGHGFWYSRQNFHDAEASVAAALEEPVNEVAADVAQLTMFIHRTIMIVQGVFFALGILAGVFTPPSAVQELNRIINSLVITVGLVGMALLLDYMSWRVRQWRDNIFAKAAAVAAAEKEKKVDVTFTH